MAKETQTTTPQKSEKSALTIERKTVWEKADSATKQKIFAFAQDYKQFLAAAKTERVATKEIIARLKKAGFIDFETTTKVSAGMRIYHNYKNKSVFAAVIGEDNSHMNLVGSHLDSPRLDVKPNPLVEKNGVALLKTHYYGGVKKYQWLNTELALYGVLETKSGKQIEFSLGEKDDEPKFMINDLLPHLAKDQLDKNAREFINAEQLQIYVGTIPVESKEAKEKVKTAVLEYLNKEYSMTEEDFLYAELTFVPAGKPSDIGFDRSLVCGYGQDDKICAYSTLSALLDVKNPTITAVAYFADKEEIGSVGNTGAASFTLQNFIMMLLAKSNAKDTKNSICAQEFLGRSCAISADVTAAMDPIFAEVHDERNAAYIGCGVAINKYTGSGGKYSANDASSEYMNIIRRVANAANVAVQVGELGKVDAGGGGTIALYLSRFGMDVIDAGPALLGMHAPREISSKADLYEAYKLYKAFLQQ